MQFTTAALLSIAVAFAAAAAAPQLLPIAENPKFSLMAIIIRSGNTVRYTAFNAAMGSIFAGLRDQGASCDKQSQATATFYLDDGRLFLNTASATPQQIFVDRSRMGICFSLSLFVTCDKIY